MSKKSYTVQWVPDTIMTTTTAGNGSVSINTPMGSGTSVSNLVPRCSCCQFCPFTDGAIYTSLPAQVKCILTNEFHFCDDTHCNVKEKVIPIKWIEEWLKTHIPYDNDGTPYIADVYELLADWEKENEIN